MNAIAQWFDSAKGAELIQTELNPYNMGTQAYMNRQIRIEQARDLVGKKVGTLTIKEFVGFQAVGKAGTQMHAILIADCDCGRKGVRVTLSTIKRRGDSITCGSKTHNKKNQMIKYTINDLRRELRWAYKDQSIDNLCEIAKELRDHKDTAEIIYAIKVYISTLSVARKADSKFAFDKVKLNAYRLLDAIKRWELTHA